MKIVINSLTMQTEGGKRLRFGMVIPCHVGGSVHEHRDRNEVLACIARHQEHTTITKLTLQMLNTEGKNEKYCAAEEARVSAEKARENAEKTRAAAAKEEAKAELAKANTEEARAAAAKEVAKAELAKANNEEARAAAAKEVAKAELAKENNEKARAKAEEARAKAEEAKAKSEKEKNKRIFELLKYSGSIGMNNLRMILGNETGSMDTTSDLYVRMNTLADGVPAVTSSDELV